MAQVEFKFSQIKAHGYPQACLCCGNDEDHQLVSRELTKPSSWAMGCGCLLFLFGPIGWLIGALIVLVTKGGKIASPVPVCQLCNAGVRSLGQRGGLFVVVATVLFIVDLAYTLPLDQWWIGVSLLLGFYGLVEYSWFMRQFQIRVVKAEADRMLLEVPYDDYPGLYQRHLDNALLYGSSESTGTCGED